jgi:hypothetical protein
MPSPFPGMDPWLEAADEWPGFHDTLVIKTVEVLQPQLRDRGYYAKPGERVWLSRSRGITPDLTVVRRPASTRAGQATVAVLEPDEPLHISHTEFEVHEGFVDIYLAETQELVSGIEYISPTNKTNKKGRRLYRQKQQELRNGGIHLVEIDLIRRGPHVLEIPEEVVERLRPWEYFVNLVRRGSEGFDVYALRLKNRLPKIRIPLKETDEDAVLDLQEVFNRSYDINPYPDILDYQDDPPPPELSPEDAAWADELLKSKGLRK